MAWSKVDRTFEKFLQAIRALAYITFITNLLHIQSVLGDALQNIVELWLAPASGGHNVAYMAVQKDFGASLTLFGVALTS